VKVNPDFKPEEMFSELASTTDLKIKRVDGRIETPEEKVDAEVALRAALADFTTKVKMVCIACGNVVSMSEAKMCECGGFVCGPCEKVEDDGVCEHEIPPEFKDQEDDE
jgi:hypothetical protein